MTRVVADTNVFISVFMFGGLPGDFLNLALSGSFRLVTSSVLLDELDEKLRGKFEVMPEDADRIRARLESVADVVSAIGVLAIVVDDPDDNRVLECAIAGRADAIVSGDRHLLRLGSLEETPIMTVRQFMNQISALA